MPASPPPPIGKRSRPGRGADSLAARVRFRRALTLMLMTVVAPGSAQLAAGNKRVGRVALHAFFVGLGFVVVVAFIGLAAQPTLVSLLTKTWFLGLLRFGLIAYAVGWAYLIVDAWRIANPLGLAQRQRLAMTALNGVLCFSLSGALLFASQFVAVQRDFIQTVFGDGAVSQAEHGRYNVLLLGGDAGPTRVGIRPDSITVASIDEVTGRTVLFALPRNLADVPFPKGSVMHKQFPHGFNCTEECYLNAVNTWATEHKELFPGVKNPGIQATKKAVEEITGLKINYSVLIDLGGFQKLVDAVGGVTVNVPEKLPIGGVGGPISGWIQPGRQHLDGFETLWFARSRATSNDYSRMARQKCVMNALLHQVKPKTVITRFGAIADAGKQIISTSIPSSDLDTFVNLALKTKDLPVSTVSFVPPKINTGDADWALIRSMVKRAIDHSRALDSDDSGADKQAKHGGRHHKRAASKTSGDGYAPNDSKNLSNTC
ncbi:MAG: LCP family protein [Nocardioidaceae bacterium]